MPRHRDQLGTSTFPFLIRFASFSRIRHALFSVSRSELSESLMRRTWLIISDGGLAGFDAEAPYLALTIDRGCPVLLEREDPIRRFDTLRPENLGRRQCPAWSCYGWHGLQARLI